MIYENIGRRSKDRVFESANIRIIASLITEDPDIFISEADRHRDSYNQFGVPHYAKKDTPAIRPETPEYQDATKKYVGHKQSRDEAKNIVGVTRTADMVGKEIIMGARTMNIIKATDTHVTLKPETPDAVEEKMQELKKIVNRLRGNLIYNKYNTPVRGEGYQEVKDAFDSLHQRYRQFTINWMDFVIRAKQLV